MDGVGIPIIERPRPLPGHDTPNPTHHTYTLKCEEPAKVARNLTRSFFEIGHKRCNSSDHISMSEICAWELRATLLGNQPDWKPTHETAAWVHWYNTRRPHLALGGITPQQAENQHTTTRKEAASTSLHKTRDLTRRVRVRRPRVRRFRLDQPQDLTRRVRIRRPAGCAGSQSCYGPRDDAF